jgi:hypothetical protein
MMRRDAVRFPQKQIALLPPDEAIEQTVPVNMTHLFPVKKETDPSIPMHSEIDAGEALRFLFHGTDRAQAAWRKYCGRDQQGGIEYLRRARHLGEPSEVSNNEGENHKERRFLNRRRFIRRSGDRRSLEQSLIASAEAERRAIH